MARATPLVVLGITLLSACVHWGLCLRIAQQAQQAQHGQLKFKADPPEGLPSDSPTSVDNPLHGGGEGETLEEKEEALADLAITEGGETAVIQEAGEVLEDLAKGDEVTETELQDLEETVAIKQTQETLAANGALLTADDLSMVHGSRMEEGGPNPGAVPLQQGDLLPAGEMVVAKDGRMSTVVGRGVGAGEPWPHGRVPYCFAPDVSMAVKTCFRSAVRVMHDNVHCLNFVEVAHVYGDSNSMERYMRNFDPALEAGCAESPAIFVRSNPDYGCYSALGVQPSWRSQAVQLRDPGCAHLGVCLHELGHAVGMHHEHQRPDRDSAITIHWDNIQPEQKQWFVTHHKVFTGQEYDTFSIMHYAPHAFAKDNTKPTITMKDGTFANLGGRGSLSFPDAEQLVEMYKSENRDCEANPRTGHGCESLEGYDCDSITTCVKEARQKCCKCGGGMQVQCFADKPCKDYSLLAGPSGPYTGWLSGGGTLGGGWWFGTIPDGLEHCKTLPGCVGITMEVPSEKALQDVQDLKKEYMMFKDHWAVGGGDTSGWTSFHIPV